MIFTSTDSSTVVMIDIACFSPGIGSPSTAFPITSSPFLIEAILSEDVEVLSATPGTGERRRKGSLSHFISRPNEKSDDPIQDCSAGKWQSPNHTIATVYTGYRCIPYPPSQSCYAQY